MPVEINLSNDKTKDKEKHLQVATHIYAALLKTYPKDTWYEAERQKLIQISVQSAEALIKAIEG